MGAVTIKADYIYQGNQATQATKEIQRSDSAVWVKFDIASMVAINNTNAGAYSISGTCSDVGQNVVVDAGGVSGTGPCTAAVVPGDPSTWSVTPDLSAASVAEGDVAITADHSDGGTNSSPQAAITVTKDTVVPVIALLALDSANIANADAYSVSGTCEAGGREEVTVSVDDSADSSTDAVEGTAFCSGEKWTVSGLDISGLVDGALAVTADYSDAAGNSAVQVTGSGTKDTVAPDAVVIKALAMVNPGNEGAYEVSGTCATGESQNVSVSIDDSDGTTSAVSGKVACGTGTWAVSGLNVSGLADGPLNVTADYSDAAGNAAPQATGTVAKFSARVGALAVVNGANKAAYSVSGKCLPGEGGTVSVSIDDSNTGNIAAVTGSGTCASEAWSVSGLNVLTLDDGSLSVTVTYDSGAPVTVTVNKDTVAPAAVVIGTLSLVNAANAVAYSVTGTCAANESEEVSVSIGDGILTTQ